MKKNILIVSLLIITISIIGCSLSGRDVATVGNEKISDIEFRYFFNEAKDKLRVETNFKVVLKDEDIKERALELAQKYKISIIEGRKMDITVSKADMDNALKTEIEFLGEGSPNEVLSQEEIDDKRSTYEKGVAQWERINEITFEQYKTIYENIRLENAYYFKYRQGIKYTDDDLKNYYNAHLDKFVAGKDFEFSRFTCEDFYKDEKLKEHLEELSKLPEYKVIKNDDVYNSITVKKDLK